MDKIINYDVESIVKKVDLSNTYNKTMLITGATGLLGTYLVSTMIKQSEIGKGLKKLYLIAHNNIPPFLKYVENIEWIDILYGDLCDDNFVKGLPNADYIINAAGYGQPAEFIKAPEKTIKLNTTLNLMLLEKLNKDGSYLFISSSGIYNGLNKDFFSESDIGNTNPYHPRACYIEGKRCGEAIVNAYRCKGVDAKSVRLSYTYGPGVKKNDERALYSFISKGKNGNISLLDDGSAERIYCYVSDAVEMILNVFLWGKNEVYNVGAKNKITILELANIIAEKCKVDAVPSSNKVGISGNALIERLDISRYEKEFGEKQFIDINEGVNRTINWISDLYY